MLLTRTRHLQTLALGGAALVLAACGGGADSPEAPASQPGPRADAGVLNIYSGRHYDSDQVLYGAFEEQTGITVRVREAGAPQLLETLRAEGANSPADVVIAADAGTLWRFKDAGLLQGVESDALEAAIPANLQDDDNTWFGFAKRYRIIIYDPERVEPGDVETIAGLADPRFEGEICVRSSSNIYNLSLLGEIIARDGSEAAAEWAEGIVANFARDPAGGDTGQIEAVAAGACSVAISNHYYWVRLAESNSADQRAVADQTALSFASVGNGMHVNVTAAGVAAHSPNRANAVAFLEFLATQQGQSLLVTETKEFPVVDGAELPAGLERLDVPAESDLPLSELGRNQDEAKRIFDRAGWP